MNTKDPFLNIEELINLPLKFQVEEIDKVTNVGVCLTGIVLEGRLLKDMKIKIGLSQLKTSVVNFEVHPCRFINGAKPFQRCSFSISNSELYSSIQKGDIVVEDK